MKEVHLKFCNTYSYTTYIILSNFEIIESTICVIQKTYLILYLFIIKNTSKFQL